MQRFSFIIGAVVTVGLVSSIMAKEICLWPSNVAELYAQADSRMTALPDGSRRVDTGVEASWPGMRLDFKTGTFDLSQYGRLDIVLSNCLDKAHVVNLSVKGRVVQGQGPGGSISLAPHQVGVLSVTLRNMPWMLDAPLKIEGMRGFPSCTSDGTSFDLRLCTSFHIFHCRDGNRTAYSVLRIVASGESTPQKVLSAKTFFPFVDRYGQFKHDDWSGKVHNDAELAATKTAEDAWLAAHKDSPIANANQYGGWLAGPKLKATGFFRTEKVNGKWWLVDPTGHLFFSHGVDCVHIDGDTGLGFRSKYFEWIPKKDDPEFGNMLFTINWPQAHGFYKEREHLPYQALSFARVNARRKYGPDYLAITRERAHERIKAWGLNTIANWSDRAIYSMDRTPYTATFGTHGPVIEGSTGWWGKLRDPFAPEFIKNIKASAAAEAKRSGNDPWCIGWFVDNELSWGYGNRDLALAVLVSPAKQSAKLAFRDWLQQKYVTSAKLDEVWGTHFGSWDGFLNSTNKVDEKRCATDLEDLQRLLVAQYFRTIRDAIKAVAPNRLYLGTRIAWGANVIYEESARYCDVVSVNIYNRRPLRDLPPNAIDKPMINGEFHFGALDRGMLHTGLVSTQNQEERAQCYREFVLSCLDHPRMVGTHWFQWQDQALTGRGDGENYQIGFVTVTDTPYPELVQAARDIGAIMYSRRFGK